MAGVDRKRTKVSFTGSYSIPPQSKDTIHSLLNQKSVLLHIKGQMDNKNAPLFHDRQ